MTGFHGRTEGRWLWVTLSTGFVLLAALPLAALVWGALPGQPLRLLADPLVREALRLSLITSAAAAFLAVGLGLPVAYLLARYTFRGRAALEVLLDLPLTLPPVVAGLGLLLAFGRMSLLGGWLEGLGLHLAFSTAAVVLAQTFLATPLFIRAAKAGFQAVPRELEEAAHGLGRGPWSVFWRVSLPFARPALVAGVVLAWARALGEFGATLMFAGNLPGVTQTLPLAVLSALDQNLSLALAVGLVSLTLACVALGLLRVVEARWKA